MEKKTSDEQIFTENSEIRMEKQAPFFNKAKSDLITSILRKNKVKSLIDLGCGTGKLSIDLAKNGFKVSGLDISERLIKKARQNGKDAKLDIDFHIGDIERLKINKRFDCVIISEVLEHIKDDVSVMKSVRKLLNEDGKLFISVPALEALRHERDECLGHLRRYSKKELKTKLKKAGFKVLRIKWWKLMMIPGVVLTKFMHKNDYPYEMLNPITKRFLKFWFNNIENKFPLPIGETIMVIAQKKARAVIK